MVLFFAIASFVGGTIIGSFSNVCVLRHGFSERRRARSVCGSCGGQLKWYDLIPLVSFVMLKGRCRMCGSRLSAQYLIVELLFGVFFLWVFLLSWPFFDFFSLLFFVLTLFWIASFLMLTVYDIRHTLVPLSFSALFILFSFLLRGLEGVVLFHFSPLIDALGGAVIVSGFLALLSLITRGRGMGAGDAIVGVGVGIIAGVSLALEVLLISFWVGAIAGGVLIGMKGVLPPRWRPSVGKEIPFVPFLFVGTILVLWGGVYPTEMIMRLY